MIDYCQETDSKMIFPLPYRQSSPFSIKPTNETTGGRLSMFFSPVPGDSSLVKSAWDTIHQTEDPEVAEEARRVLSIIRETFLSFQQLGFDLGHLPPLRAFNVDDGSVLIEWIFGDFRIGFGIEPNSEDSGWYLVSNPLCHNK